MNSLLIAFVCFCVALIIGGTLWYRSNPVSAGRPGSLLVLMGALGLVGLLLSGCGERGPAEEDLRGCSSHRTPTWGDVIDCRFEKDRARHEETVK